MAGHKANGALKREESTGQKLIVYYSRTSKSEKIANQIQKEIGGMLHKILPETPHPNGYDATFEQAKEETKREDHPPLRKALYDLEGFDLTFVGPPN